MLNLHYKLYKRFRYCWRFLFAIAERFDISEKYFNIECIVKSSTFACVRFRIVVNLYKSLSLPFLRNSFLFTSRIYLANLKERSLRCRRQCNTQRNEMRHKFYMPKKKIEIDILLYCIELYTNYISVTFISMI